MVSVLLLRSFVSAYWLGYNMIDERESHTSHNRVGYYAVSKTSKDKYYNLGKDSCWMKGLIFSELTLFLLHDFI